jgi:hypothetical protein
MQKNEKNGRNGIYLKKGKFTLNYFFLRKLLVPIPAL